MYECENIYINSIFYDMIINKNRMYRKIMRIRKCGYGYE